jgi:hypothetical protein
LFDNASVQEYFSKYGGGVEHLAKIGADVIRIPLHRDIAIPITLPTVLTDTHS